MIWFILKKKQNQFIKFMYWFILKGSLIIYCKNLSNYWKKLNLNLNDLLCKTVFHYPENVVLKWKFLKEIGQFML